MSFKVGGGPLLLNFSFFPFVRLFSVPPPSRGQVWFTRYWESKSVPTEMVRMGCCLYLLGLGKRKMRKDRFSYKCTGQSRDLAVCRRKEGERDVSAWGSVNAPRGVLDVSGDVCQSSGAVALDSPDPVRNPCHLWRPAQWDPKLLAYFPKPWLDPYVCPMCP